jgi:Fe-S-cluster containining protein
MSGLCFGPSNIKQGMGELLAVSAGNFSEWLRGAEASLQSGQGGTAVPCGTCTACCRSSMFVHIGPEETQTIQRIPRALLFAAPGRPKGHLVMGYNHRGHCPMLLADKCSIYEHRPQTCRTYDCRIFAATGVPVEPQNQADIPQRAQAWRFDYETKESRQEHKTMQAAAAFLQKNASLFPPGSLPTHPAQLAAASGKSDALIAQAIVTALNQPGTSSKRGGRPARALRYTNGKNCT